MNVRDIVNAIANAIGASADDVYALVEAKKRDLGYLVSDEVAARLVAREKGVQVPVRTKRFKMKISDLKPGMTNVNIGGVIKEVLGIERAEEVDGKIIYQVSLEVEDESGKARVVLWTEDGEVQRYRGMYLEVISGHTREVQGGLEVRVGKEGRVEVSEVVEENFDFLNGIVVRAYDPINYEAGRQKGTVTAAIVKLNDGDLIRLVLWNLNVTLDVGDVIKILKINVKDGFRGLREIHISDAKWIKVVGHVEQSPMIKRINLSQLRGGEKDVAVEGVVEGVFRGNVFAKLLLREGETVVPVIFWRDKAGIVERLTEGMKISIEGCKCRVARNGLELHVMRWSKVRVL